MSVATAPKGGAVESRNLGVLFCGYVDKMNPYSGAFKKRYLVLTHEAIHWFLRGESDDLFGAERGRVSLANVLTVRILDEDTVSFELQSADFKKRVFKSNTASDCEEWVSAVRSAVKKFSHARDGEKKLPKRRLSLSAAFGTFGDSEDLDDGSGPGGEAEVSVLVVSLCSQDTKRETVLTRNPSWKRLVRICNMCTGDELIITMSNGGTTALSLDTLLYKADVGAEFEAPIDNVLLSSSLKIRVAVEQPVNDVDDSAAKKKANSSLFADVELLLSLTQSSNALTILFIVAVMVILCSLRNLVVGAISPTEHSSLDVVVISVFSLVLAAGTLKQARDISTVRVAHPSSPGGSKDSDTHNLCVYLLDHQYISPDDPVKEPEEEIPQRFIVGCDGDLREARRRWDLTRKWRESEGISSILQEPQPYFTTIKTLWPHYICGRGKSGHAVYYERPGDIELDQMKARGISLPDLLRHWIFITEYFWNHVAPDPQAKAISVLDIGTVNMAVFAGETLEFIRKTISVANQHYPERAYVVFIVNAPSWFSWVWRMMKPLVHENTQKKVKILAKKEILSGLLEHIEMDQIPCYYGGGMNFGSEDSCRFQSPDEVALAEFVCSIGKASSEAGNSDSNLDATSPASPAAADGDLSRSPPAHFSRGVSFLSDEHPPPPPPAGRLTRADLSNDSPVVHRSRNGHDAVSDSSDLTDPSMNGDKSASRNKGRGLKPESPLARQPGGHSAASPTLRAVFARPQLDDDDDDDYSSQGQPSSVGGGGKHGKRS